MLRNLKFLRSDFMSTKKQENFIDDIIKIIDRWSFEQCAHCEDGTLVSIEGMLDFRCSKCGKPMNPLEYLGEIAKVVFNYREDQGEFKENNKKET
jgi:hypothetical protein